MIPGGEPTEEEIRMCESAAAASTADAARELEIDPIASLQ